MRSASELEKIRSELANAKSLLDKKISQLAKAKAVRENFIRHYQSAEKVRKLERGATNKDKFFEKGSSTEEANLGYDALVQAFVERNELRKEADGTSVLLRDDQRQKFEIVKRKMGELLTSPYGEREGVVKKYAAEVVKEFSAEKKYDLVHPRTKEKYKSRVLKFSIPSHAMIAEIREYEDKTKTVAWINGGEHAEQDPNNPKLVKILSERKIALDENLEELVFNLISESREEHKDISFMTDRSEWSYKPGLPQIFGNCSTNSINILINYYLRDQEDPELAASFRSFVENFKSEELAQELHSNESVMCEEVRRLENDFEAKKRYAKTNDCDPEDDAKRDKIKKFAEERKRFHIEEKDDSEVVNKLQQYLSGKSVVAPEITKFESSIKAQSGNVIPPFCRSPGFRCDLVKDCGTGGVSSLSITEIFSAELQRFSMIPNDGNFLNEAGAKKLVGLSIIEITTPSGEKINIAELFQPPKDRKAGEKKLVEVLHDSGRISFKATNDGLEEINFACDRGRESVFVTAECDDDKVKKYFKEKNDVGDFQTGAQYNPKLHGAELSADTRVRELPKPSAMVMSSGNLKSVTDKQRGG